MPFFKSEDDLHRAFEELFRRIEKLNGVATRPIKKSRLVIQLKCEDPPAIITLNGKKNPVKTCFGAIQTRPDLQITMPADVLHQIFLGELSLKKAVSNKQLKVRGPVWKVSTMSDVFDQGKKLYPLVLQDEGFID